MPQHSPNPTIAVWETTTYTAHHCSVADHISFRRTAIKYANRGGGADVGMPTGMNSNEQLQPLRLVSIFIYTCIELMELVQLFGTFAPPPRPVGRLRLKGPASLLAPSHVPLSQAIAHRHCPANIMDPDPNMVTEQNFLDRLLPDDVFESFNPLVPMSTHLALQPTEPDPLAFSFPAPVDVTHPRSCPPLSLARSPPNDQAPLLELPMNIQQLPQGGADPMIFTTSEPAVREDVIPIPPADFSASHSPTVRCRPIVPRTPAPSVIPTPATPSSRICTPMSALAISEGVQQPPPTSLPPSMSTPPSTTMRIAKRKHRRCKLPGTPVTPTTATTPPILDQVLSSSHMKAFGTSERDVSMAFDMVNQCVQERAHGCKIKLRKLLKDDSKVTSSQREAKVSRLFHHEVLRGYQGALMEVIGAWYKASAALHHANEQQKRSGL